MTPLTLSTEPPVPGFKDLRYFLAEVPRQVRLESSAYCNMRCVPCHGHGYKKMTRPKGFMDLELVEALLQEITRWNPPLEEIVPTNFGEWFLHPGWDAIGNLIDSYLPKVRLVVPTSGILVTEETLTKLASLQTLKLVNWSINAYFAETYERFHGISSRYLPRIRQMVEWLKDMRPDVTVWVSMVYDSSVQTEIERDLFQRFWGQVAQVQIAYASYTSNPTKSPSPLVTLPCRSVFDGLTVFWDGRVGTNCCFDGDAASELYLGHVPEERLLDIWKGERLARLAWLHNEGQRGEIPLCQRCTFA